MTMVTYFRCENCKGIPGCLSHCALGNPPGGAGSKQVSGGWKSPPQPVPPYGGVLMPSAQKGCICPPGSEQTCQRRDCGRKDAQCT